MALPVRALCSLCGRSVYGNSAMCLPCGRLPGEFGLPLRIWEKIDRSSGECWLWTGRLNQSGYGITAWGARGGKDRVHRIVFRAVRKVDLLGGEQLDHLCRVRHCCNPDHLEAVEQRVNVVRGAGAALAPSKRSRYVGLHFDNRDGRWSPRARLDGKRVSFASSSESWRRTMTTTTKAQMMNNKPVAAATFIGYAATIPAANWMINHVGTEAFPGGPHTIPVGFGYDAPSGVLMIGVALVLRDVLQRAAGKALTVAAIAVGVALSFLFADPGLAAASGVAFALGELADFAIYTPLERRNRPVAVLVSGVIGAVVDSLVFLQIAFGSSAFWQGQVIGKTYMAALGAGLIWSARAVPDRFAARTPRPVQSA